ncbi:MAG: response regulator transcription factor [Bacteroidetes bacterium]|uniref:Response regulator transcription factor n=1 Tax=Phaeocystidibacter marisrubri TaxID=1577780 RepID=A0A6L3ZEW5_9FLAO|nr:LytTR family DNA-binding domain-containing protein [Phaeocystidibacter marisrubri]KAB2815942.1 response regulator transcription factor [Phaeocystidibacter marisrubri]TNE31354.1 MAG: response regulator transcription factor [Bacteroidota bacterium]GGH66510.1 DNA-binding response regulator [Phaeocystidibacter marisrubri]
MLKALIIDDEANSRAALKGKLELFCPDINPISEAGDIESALKEVIANKPDVMFLDVKLAGETGFELLERIHQEEITWNGEVIFTTAHDEFALKAIKFSALDYLLKPIDPEELVKAVRKVQQVSNEVPSGNISVLLENFRSAAESPKKIVIPSSDGMHIIKVSDILRCESSSNYTQFVLKTGKNLLASKTLKEFDNMLTDHNFERIHKSHLVNMNYVKRYVQSDGGYVIMEDDSKIPVANRKKEHLMALLKAL